MLFLKPIFRTVILSTILSVLIIYLGIKYHWSDYIKVHKTDNISSLEIPRNNNSLQNQVKATLFKKHQENFTPKILPTKSSDNLISSMNKEQVRQHCKLMLSNDNLNNKQLNLAVVNCTVSNYQESHQTIYDSTYLSKKKVISANCQKQFTYKNQNQYTYIEKQLLVGICISDKLTQ